MLSRVTVCGPVDCSPRGSSIQEILQARTLEWVAIPFSKRRHSASKIGKIRGTNIVSISSLKKTRG